MDESMELWTRVGLVGALVGELAEVVEREVDGLLTNGSGCKAASVVVGCALLARDQLTAATRQ